MAVDIIQRSITAQDIPATAQNLSTSSTVSVNTTVFTFTGSAELTKSATAGVTNFYLINSSLPMRILNNVLNFQMANKDTRFENLVFAITQGYAAGSKTFQTDQDFAKQACDLARSIAFQMDKYSA